ncbi:MAG: hypothetical protein KF691_00085 [Phycisphaeraceae bacterium]|nr:hypothetical protein [Phycisphaeraceae bacterium]
MSQPIFRRALAHAAVLALCLGSLARAQLGTVYEGHLAIQSRNSGTLDMRGLSIANDIIGGQYGLHPTEGPHSIAGDPSFYTKHLSKFTSDLNESIPDKNFSGIIVLDYEYWWPNWEWTAPNVQTAWSSYVKTQRLDLLAGHLTSEYDRIIKDAYLAEVRKYYEFTIGLCRQLRPQARISVYAIPFGTYWIFNGGTQSGVNLARYKEINQVDLAWYYNLVDVICPTIYQSYSVGNPPGPGQIDAQGPSNHILGIVGEAVTAGRGKPVYPFMQFRYHPSSYFSRQFMSPESLDLCIRLPRQAGAKGIILWDFFYTDTEVTQWQNYYDSAARPVLAANLSNGSTGGPGGTGGTNPGTSPGGGTDPGTSPGTGPDPGTSPGGGTDPGTSPGSGTDPGTSPGGGPDPGTGSGGPDPFGGTGNSSQDPTEFVGGSGSSEGGSSSSSSSSGAASSGSSGGGGDSGGGGGSSGGGSGSGSGSGLDLGGGGGGGSVSSGPSGVSFVGVGSGATGSATDSAPISADEAKAALAGIDPRFVRTFRGGKWGKGAPFTYQEISQALARAKQRQNVDGVIKDPKVKLPETAVAGVPTE